MFKVVRENFRVEFDIAFIKDSNLSGWSLHFQLSESPQKGTPRYDVLYFGPEKSKSKEDSNSQKRKIILSELEAPLITCSSDSLSNIQ